MMDVRKGREQCRNSKRGITYAPKYHGHINDYGVRERDGLTRLVGISSPCSSLCNS